MAKRTLSKVEFEILVDQYLANDMPLSIIIDTYNVTYPQMHLLANRVIGYDRQIAYLTENYDSSLSNEHDEGLLSIPHNIEEQNPFNKEEHNEQFKRLAEIKEQLAKLSNLETISTLQDKLNKKKKELSNFDYNLIQRIEKFVNDLDHMQENNQTIDYLLAINGIFPKDLPSFDHLYNSYLNCQQEILTIEQQLQQLNEVPKTSKVLNKEYETIREQLVIRNIKLVNWCIRTFFNGIPLPKEEAQMYGLEGLIKAINSFDYTLGYQFSSYAVPTITHNIQRYFEEMMGISWRDFIKKESINYYRRLMKEADPKHKGQITPEELAEMGLVPYTAKAIANIDEMKQFIPMADAFKESEQEYPNHPRYEMPTTFEDYNSIDEYEDGTMEESSEVFDEVVEYHLLREELLSIIKTLPYKEQEIIIHRYGLNGEEPKTLESLAKMYEITPERVRQIEAKALRRFRHPARSKFLRPFYGERSHSSSMYYDSKTSSATLTNNIYTYLVDLLKAHLTFPGILRFLKMRYNIEWSMDDLTRAISSLNKLYIIIHQLLNEDKTIGEIIDELNKGEMHYIIFGSEYSNWLNGFSENLIKNIINKYEIVDINVAKLKV